MACPKVLYILIYAYEKELLEGFRWHSEFQSLLNEMCAMDQ